MQNLTQECNKLEFLKWLVSYAKLCYDCEIKTERLAMITKDDTTIKLYVYEEGDD